MTLTVPTAPVSAGARAPTLRLDTPQTGEVIAGFGDVMKQVGDRLETDRLDRAAQRLQLDITRDLGRARLEFEQMTDPDQIDTLWPQRVAELRTQYLSGNGQDGRPRVDRKLANRVGLIFEELGERHALALAGNAIALRHSQRAATYIEYTAETSAQAATTDVGTLDALIQGRIDQINQLRAAGTFTPEQAAAEIQKATGEVLNAHVIGLIDSDPAAFLEAADAGVYDRLGGEALAQRRVQAQGALDRQAAAAATEAERLSREAEQAEAANLRRIADVVGRGGRISTADRDLVAGSTHQLGNATRAALALSDEIPDLARKSPAELQALIRAEEAKTVAEGYELERVEYLRQLQARLQTGYSSDPVATDAAVGGAVAQLPQFDPANPQAFTGGLAQRMAQGFDRFATGKGAAPQFLTAAERESYRAIAAPEADPAARARLIQSALTAAEQLPAAQRRQALTGFLTEVGATEVMRHAADLIAGGGRADLVPTMLRGEQKLRLGTIAVPSEAQQRVAFQTVTGGAMDNIVAPTPQIMAAAAAIYADRAGAIDPETMKGAAWAQGAAQAAYTEALQLALGAQPDASGNLTIGGVQTVKGRPTLLPVGVPQAEAERVMQDVDALLRGGRWRPQGDLSGWDYSAGTGPNLVPLQRASRDRQRIPQLTWGHWQDTSIEPVQGTSYYRLRYHGADGTSQIVPDDRGEDFLFSLPVLMMEIRQ
jgi:hypothetical protein